MTSQTAIAPRPYSMRDVWLPAVAIGLEGTLATIYTHDGQRQLREGEVTSEVERLRTEVERLRGLLDDH